MYPSATCLFVHLLLNIYKGGGQALFVLSNTQILRSCDNMWCMLVVRHAIALYIILQNPFLLRCGRWGLFRDRRPELYTPLLTLDGTHVHKALQGLKIQQ